MNTLPGLIGKKLGFTQVFDASGNVARVTVVEAGPCVVVRKRTEEKDGYTALQLSFGERRAKLTSKPLQGYFDKSKAPARTIKNKQGHDIQVYPRTLKEIRLSAEEAAKYNEGDVLTASDIFKEGQFVDVSGTTIGRGFSGVIRRHHFAGFVSSHGTHEYFRHGGSIGCRLTPQRVHKGKRMAGQMGNEKTTIQNLQLFRIMADDNCILVRGSIPGAPNEYVVVTKAATRESYKRRGMGKEEVRSKNPLKASKKAAAGRG